MKLLFAQSREELITHIDALNAGDTCEIYWYVTSGACVKFRFDLSVTYKQYLYTIMRGPKAGMQEWCDKSANFGNNLKFKNPPEDWNLRKLRIIKNIKALQKYCL